jgi:hypothetical protein
VRALTLTQPFAGLVASGLKRVENRPRKMIKAADFGQPFAIHASREINFMVYDRLRESSPDLWDGFDQLDEATWPSWYRLSRITSAVIGVATVDKVLDGWDEDAIRDHADVISYSNGENLGPAQIRWFFGPVGYVLHDDRVLTTPVPCRGQLGFWTLPDDVAALVTKQIEIPA